jgi:hypothetical protein
MTTLQTYYHAERPITRPLRWDWLFPSEITIGAHTYPATPDHEYVALPFLQSAKVCRECGEPPIHMICPLEMALDVIPTAHCCKCDVERERTRERLISIETRSSSFGEWTKKSCPVMTGEILDTWETAPEEVV